jgi:putative component of membrane protein insertase Oxa1/YidC/SpoIIIJ protein YidD
VILGSSLTISRIVRCNPWSQGGIDQVKDSGQRFVVLENGFVATKSKEG